MLRVRREQAPTIHGAAGDHDDFRVDDVDEICEADAEVSTELSEHPQREFVTIASCIVNAFRRQLLTIQHRIRKLRQALTRHPPDRGRRCKQLETTNVAATALQSRKRIDRSEEP